MKVLDLCCDLGHVFEGWFASEEDFQSQQSRGLVTCPTCGSAQVVKKLSAPRLNLGAKEATPEPQGVDEVAVLRAMYQRVVQEALQHTTDVGEAFVEQARKMHAGEMAEAPIRGKATLEEAQELHEEGIPVLPLILPEGESGGSGSLQ